MTKGSKNNSIPDIHQAIGSALSNWTCIEIQLHQIFNICLNLIVMQPGGGYSMGNDMPSAVLDSVDGFRSKLGMIEAALEAVLKGLDDETEILNDWAKAKDNVSSLSLGRNKLAHWTVSTLFKDGVRRKVRLVPPFYSTEVHVGLCATDIAGLEKAFIAAQVRLSAIAERLASHQGLQRKFVQQVASQIQCCLPDDPSLLEFLKHELSLQ